MNSMRKSARAGLLIVLALLVCAPLANADALDIALSVTGTPTVPGNVVATATSGTSVAYGNSNFDGFNINLLATSSNSPGTATIAQLTGTNLSITNNNSSTATLYITFGDGGFASPTTPPNLVLDSHIGGTVVIGNAANLLTYSSYVNPDNSQNGTSGFTSGVQSPGITSGSFSNDAFLTLTSLVSPYSVTELFAITLAPGAEINFSTSSTLSPAVPEPSSIALLAISALGLTGFVLGRRRKGYALP